MTGPDASRRAEQHRVVKAFITACVVAFMIPFVTVVVSAFAGGIGRTAANVIGAANVVIVVSLMVRWFLMYRTYKARRSA